MSASNHSGLNSIRSGTRGSFSSFRSFASIARFAVSAMLRLTPVFPFWMLNLGLGLTRVRLRDYTWATLVGLLPMTLVVANAGASLAEVTTLRDVVSLRVLGAVCLLPLAAYALHRLVRVPEVGSANQKP